MDSTLHADEIDRLRRQFFGSAALGVAALPFAARAGAPAAMAAPAPRPVARFDAVKQIDAGVLNIGYVDLGPVGGKPVILLHGWPYDIHAFAEVGPALAAAGYRVIIPHLRGHGTTRFRS